MSTPNIITFFPNPLFDNENVLRISNEITYPKKEYLPGSEFLVNLTDFNNEFPKIHRSQYRMAVILFQKRYKNLLFYLE